MKWILFLLLFSICFTGVSQQTGVDTGPFIRIYNADGKKIAKGKFLQISDGFEELKLLLGVDTIRIPASDISYILTKRSSGHSVLVGGATGFASGFTLGLIAYDQDVWLSFGQLGEPLIFGTLFGVVGGALGSIAAGLKKSDLYMIEEDPENLNKLRLKLFGAKNE